MNTRWIVTEIDGKIAALGTDYRHLARIGAEIEALDPDSIGSISTRKIDSGELVALSRQTRWEDLRLFGTDFQLKIWKALFELPRTRIYSYTEFAAIAQNPLGVRPVAHAVAINPVAFIVPCHLIVPKETLDKAREIREVASKTLFKGEDLYLLDSIDVGAYAYGPAIKRELIKLDLA